jgi:sugar lactone lactonase YvrE
VVWVLLLVVAASSAVAAETPPSVRAQDFATGFTVADNKGPIGVAFDPAGRLYVGSGDGIHRFGPEGGRMGPETRLSHRVPGKRVTGLAFDAEGRLFAGWTEPDGNGGIVQVDPVSGAMIRVVADGLRCPVGLAISPVTGDLYVSQVTCQPRILRITNPASDGAQVATFAEGFVADGLTFTPDGTLWVAHEPLDGGMTVSRYDSGRRTGVAAIPAVDGVAVSRDGTFLIGVRTDGRITRADLRNGLTGDVLTGGSRGDLAAAGPDGCLYATQSDRVLKLTNADGGCTGDTSSGPVAPGLEPTSPPFTERAIRAASCGVPTAVLISPRFGRARLRQARIYVDGRLRRTLRGRAARRDVLLRGLPGKAFAVTVRGTTLRGRTLTRTRSYGGSCGCRATRRLRVPTAWARRAGATRLRISVGGRVVRRLSGRAARRGVVISAPGRPFTLTVRATTRSGRTIVRRRVYGCAG